MVQTKNGFELLKTKLLGYFFALWGVTFFFMALAYLASYAFNGSTEPTAVIALYIIADVGEIAAAIVLWAISIKILSAKS